MPWPTPQDYNEAIQNPAFTFSDRELQVGSCEVTALGLPKPITGNFASVYRLHCQGRDWAVRCFWRELSDMQQRYRAISAHLATAGLPYTVGFEYQPQGIRVRGSWYPILKMEWVEGQLLNDYLVSHLNDQVTLRSLMDSWLRMMSDLELAGCAHGDLQHGNILVVNGELKLVDYDGMFVPALRGIGSHELGQQHYQHPRRDATDFGPYLDRFSSWVIYLSIAAIRVDPSLWASTQAGDERLLLQRKDFEDPAASTALALLVDHSDPELQALANLFKASIERPVTAVPSLSTAVNRGAAPPRVDSAASSRNPSRLTLWWRLLAPSSSAAAVPPEVPSPGAHPSWVVDHLPVRREISIVWSDRQVRASRLGTLVSCPLAGIGGIGLLAIGAPPVLAVGVSLLFWLVASFLVCLVAYRHDPSVQALTAQARSERAWRKFDTRIERELQRDARRRDAAARRTGRLQKDEEAELEKVRTALARSLDSVEARIREVDRREAEETERALAELQSRHIGDTLRRASLRRASIPGIDLATKMRLWTLGVWAAADVTSGRIRTMQHLDHEHLMRIVTWRVGAETEARRTMPRQLPAEHKRALHQQFASERLDLVTEQGRAESAADADLQDIEASFAARREAIADDLERALEDSAEMRAALEARAEQLRICVVKDSETRHADLHEVQTKGVHFGAFVRAVWNPWM